MSADRFLRKSHRVISGLFLLSIIPAANVSAQGNEDSAWVYAPLPFLFILIITGTYMLVKPWVAKAQRKAQA